MASINLSGVLKDPEGNPDVGAIVKFTLLSTTGDTVKSSVSELIVPPDGSYNIDLVYGLVRVDYITNWKERFVAIITVNADTVATSIPELLNASTPPTKPQLLQFQNILADAVAAKDAAESAAATLDIVNDLTLPYVFDTVADMTASVIAFPVGKSLETKSKLTAGGGGLWDAVLTSGVTPDGEFIIQSTGVPTLSFKRKEQGTMAYGLPTDAVNVSAILRQANFNDGWSFIDDTNHRPSGFIGPITVNNLQIDIPLEKSASKIGSVSVTMDEKFAQKVSVGATFGLDKVGLKLYADLNVLVNNDTLATAVNEFQNPAFITVTKNPDGSVTLDHPNLAINAGGNDPRSFQQDGSGAKPIYSMISQDTSQVTYASFRPMGGLFQHSTGNAFNTYTEALDKPVAVWVGDHLQVTHEEVSSSFHNVSITPKSAAFDHYVDSVTSTGFNVYFFDKATGAAITSPNSTIKLYYSVGGSFVRDEDTTGKCWINVGKVQIDPAYVFNSSGNIWINAIYEPVRT